MNNAHGFGLPICCVTFFVASILSCCSVSGQSAPCPKKYLFTMGGLYFYTTVICGGSAGSCTETPDDIYGYQNHPDPGCNPDTCECDNVEPAAAHAGSGTPKKIRKNDQLAAAVRPGFDFDQHLDYIVEDQNGDFWRCIDISATQDEEILVDHKKLAFMYLDQDPPDEPESIRGRLTVISGSRIEIIRARGSEFRVVTSMPQ